MRRFTLIAIGRPRPRQARDGYVLLMTLVLIAVAVLSQAGFARRSLQLALEANEAQQELQRRWATESCRQFFLDEADRHFIALEENLETDQPVWPVPRQLAAEFTLGDLRLRAILADEDAKANLNTLHARKPADTRLAIMEVAGEIVPELRPNPTREAKLRKKQFGSWGQVFNVASLLSEDRFDALLAACGDLSCWGRGKLNVRRASDQAITLAVGQTVSREVLQELLEARHSFVGDLLLADLLEGLDLRRTEQLKLRSALSDSSSCYSLWLELEDDKRRWYHLLVAGDSAGTGVDSVQSFHW